MIHEEKIIDLVHTERGEFALIEIKNGDRYYVWKKLIRASREEILAIHGIELKKI